MAEPQYTPVDGSAPRNGTNGTNGSNGHSLTTSNGTAVIDLRDPPATTTRVRVEREHNPFASLSKPERMKLIIRVLCEIVAYGEADDETAPVDTPAV